MQHVAILNGWLPSVTEWFYNVITNYSWYECLQSSLLERSTLLVGYLSMAVCFIASVQVTQDTGLCRVNSTKVKAVCFNFYSDIHENNFVAENYYYQ